MTFVLHCAERADVLACALTEVVSVPLRDPFEREVVAVHSRGIERWLSNRLAGTLGASPGRGDGIAANLSFPFPGRLVGEALAAATGVNPSPDPWRPERLVWPLLDVIAASIEEPWLRVLAAHLGGVDPEAPDRDRRFAAVRHVADLFDRYAVHRPDMLLAWAQGQDRDGTAGPLPDDAVWQAEAWRRLRSVVAVPSPAERTSEGCAALVADPGLVPLPARLSLFGLTRLPASYLDVLKALAVHRDVHLFALQPSAEGWSEAADEPGLDLDEVTDRVRHPLLRSWGQDSREMHLVLSARLIGTPGAEQHHHPLIEGEHVSLLARLQQAIRHDQSPEQLSELPPLANGDASVQIHSCHGRARQAEVVRDAITHLFAADPTLEPRDVVVMCPDIDEFAPMLRAAFGDSDPVEERGAVGAPRIPYRLADRSIRQTNPVLGAISELLALVDARLTVSQVLTFAGLPPVRQRFSLGDGDLDRMAEWVEATGIHWGLDASHRAPYGLASVAEGTWETGLRRLLLGVAIAEEDHRLFGGVLPLDDLDSGEIDLAGRFAELIGRLGAVLDTLHGPLTLEGWVAGLGHAADLVVATRPGEEWQRSQLDRLLTETLAEAGEHSEQPLRLAEVRDLLADRLRGRPTRAAFRTGALTMCTLVPMRSVPHRVVCLVGLDDGAFPRGGARDGDDLLVRNRRPGDYDRRAEDRQLLLDAVLATGDTLVITYAGRDVRTNETLPPAVPVNELLDLIDRSVRTTDGRRPRTRIVTEHPLQPTSPRCFEAGALGTSGPWSYDSHLLAGAIATSRPPSPVAPFMASPLPARRVATIALQDVIAFVRHPVRAFLRQRLEVSLPKSRNGTSDGLPVQLDALAAWGVGDRLLAALLAGGDPDEVCAAEVARGLLPPGALGTGALEKARDKALKIIAAADEIATGPRRSIDIDVALGDGRRLVGTVPDLVDDVILMTTYSQLKPGRLAAAWVRFLAASAAHPDRPLRSVSIGSGRNPFVLAPIGATSEGRRGEAVRLLDIVVDLHDRGLREPLPLYCATSHRYVDASRVGRIPPVDAAAKEWTTVWGHTKEDRDPEHLLVLGGQLPFDDLLADGPRPDESGDGWAMDEVSRFGRLAARLWSPVLNAAGRAAP